MKKEVNVMAIMDGCESKHKTPTLEERTCPVCGFTRRGRIIEDTACDCGYVFKAEEQLEPQQRKVPKE